MGCYSHTLFALYLKKEKGNERRPKFKLLKNQKKLSLVQCSAVLCVGGILSPVAEQMSVQIQMQIVVSAATTVGISNSRRLVFLPLLLYSVSSSSSYLSFMFPSSFPLFDIQHAHTRLLLLFIALLSFFSLKKQKIFPCAVQKTAAAATEM